jgi:hypothetical protein
MMDRKRILKFALNLATWIALVVVFEFVETRHVSPVAWLRVLFMLPAFVALSFRELGRWRWLLFTATGLCLAGDFLYVALS